MRARKCYICGADVTSDERDWGIILTRKDHVEERYGTLIVEATRKRVHGSWPLCEDCADVAVRMIARTMEEARR